MGAMLFLVLLALYFIPWIIAAMRSHPQALAIFMLNLLLGWTLVGWVIALVWAVMAFQPQNSLHRNS